MIDCSSLVSRSKMTGFRNRRCINRDLAAEYLELEQFKHKLIMTKRSFIKYES